MTDLRSGAKGVAAGEKSKNQLSRDFRRRPIFDFCSSIGHKQKRLPNVVMSASVPYCRTLDTRIETRKGRPDGRDIYRFDFNYENGAPHRVKLRTPM
jgi:hypothetical protein